MKAVELTKRQRLAAVRQAHDVRETLEPLFDSGDMDEKQFKLACRMYASALILMAQLNSIEGEMK